LQITFIYLRMVTRKNTKKAAPAKKASTAKKKELVPTAQEQTQVQEEQDDDLPVAPELNMKERVKRKKTGGRQKGTQNKVTTVTKEILSDMLGDYQESGLMTADFLALEPKDRIQCAEKMMQYILPKMQSTSVDFNNKATKITIEQKLRELSEENDTPTSK
jgi:hypothetical protein